MPPAQAVTGRGGGLTDAAFEKKKQVIDRALALHRPDPADPVGVLAAVGGLDLAAMTGAFLGCAQNHVPAVVDGYISIVAALTAVRLCPAAESICSSPTPPMRSATASPHRNWGRSPVCCWGCGWARAAAAR